MVLQGQRYISARSCGCPTVPSFAEDGGDESEIAGVYIIDNEGQPRRVGMAQGNEFSDHVLEKKNYLYLASCKLRECSIGPELVLDPDFHAVPGVARVYRESALLWQKPIQSGEANMCHSLENMEHHHFKFPCIGVPGMYTCTSSAPAAQLWRWRPACERRRDGGELCRLWPALANPLAVESGPAKLARVLPL